jgi:hypothetical protein
MTDETTPTSVAPAVDPVAEARKIMAAQEAAPAGEIAGLKKQIKTLWALVIVTLVLTLAFGAYSVFGRMIGLGRPNFGNGNFQPGQFRQQGATGSGTGTIQQ